MRMMPTILRRWRRMINGKQSGGTADHEGTGYNQGLATKKFLHW